MNNNPRRLVLRCLGLIDHALKLELCGELTELLDPAIPQMFLSQSHLLQLSPTSDLQ